MKYTFAVYKTFGYEAWDYTHPLHQTIRYTDILDDPFGAFLSRTEHGNGKYEGTFTGCTTDIDVKRHQFQITRDEPEYWFKRGINGLKKRIRSMRIRCHLHIIFYDADGNPGRTEDSRNP